MALPELCILDVGHGNCAVIHAHEGVVVVDAPLGRTLIEFLLTRHIREIDVVFVSHADADHVEGITTLLLDDRFLVRKIVVNPDATKETRTWENFRIAVKEAELRHTVAISRDLGSTLAPIILGATRIEVLG